MGTFVEIGGRKVEYSKSSHRNQRGVVPPVASGAGDKPGTLSSVFQEVWSLLLFSPTHQNEGLWGMFSRRTRHEINSILTLPMTLHINIQ